MKDCLLISVIIPVYNVQPYLSEAIESVLNQSYRKLEIILIDDGSTDGSGVFCDEYSKKDDRINVIHQNNKGLSNARNTGLDAMSGDAVLFLDPDDAYQPNFVRTMVNTMVRHFADLVICKYTEINFDGTMTRRDDEKGYPLIEAGVYSRKDILCALADNMINQSVWNKLYRRELWDDIRYPEGHVYEDRCTTFRIMNICRKICVLDDIMYLHRVRSGSITNTYSQRNLSDWLLAFTLFNDFIESNIPEIYKACHLKKNRQFQLYVMIIGFYRVYGVQKDFRMRLRQQIVDLERKVGIETLSGKIKFQYFLIRFCPYVAARYSKIHFVKRFFEEKTKKIRDFLGKFL